MSGLLFKRVSLLAVFCAILSFFISGRLDVPVGIIAGGLISVCKLRIYEYSIDTVCSGTKNVLTGLLIVLPITITLLSLVAAILVSLGFFAGLTAGLLLIIPVIIYNAALEWLAPGKE